RPRPAMEAGRYTGASAERGTQGRVTSFRSQFEVLRFSLAQPVLNYLGQPAATELESDEGDRIRITVTNSTGGRRRRNRDRALAKQRHQEIHEMDASFVQRTLQHLAAPSGLGPRWQVHQLPGLGEHHAAGRGIRGIANGAKYLHFTKLVIQRDALSRRGRCGKYAVRFVDAGGEWLFAYHVGAGLQCEYAVIDVTRRWRAHDHHVRVRPRNHIFDRLEDGHFPRRCGAVSARRIDVARTDHGRDVRQASERRKVKRVSGVTQADDCDFEWRHSISVLMRCVHVPRRTISTSHPRRAASRGNLSGAAQSDDAATQRKAPASKNGPSFEVEPGALERVCATGGCRLGRQDSCVPAPLCPQLARNFGKAQYGIDATHAHNLEARVNQFLAQVGRVVLAIARRYVVSLAREALCVRAKQKVTARFQDSHDFA